MIYNEFNDAVLSWEMRNKEAIPSESTLFRCLVNALKRDRVETYCCFPKVVRFEDGSTPRASEFCDALVLLRFDNYYRFSFVQFRRYLGGYFGLGNIRINCVQHHRLFTKKDMVFNGVKSRLLNNIAYDSATTYAVFYKNRFEKYDMDLSSAKNVICKNANSCNFNRSFAVASHRFNQIHCIQKQNLLVEFDTYLNLKEIEEHPEFGEVVKFGTPLWGDLNKILSTFAIKDEVKEKFHLNDNKNSNVYYNRDNNFAIKRLLLVDCRKSKD